MLIASKIVTCFSTTVIWKIFSVELLSFCAIIDEIKSHEFFFNNGQLEQ